MAAWFAGDGSLVFLLMSTWKRGGQLLTERTSGEAIELDMFIDALLISEPTRVAGTAVFMTSRNDRVPNAMLHNLMHNKVLHERVLVLSVEVFDVPYAPEIDRVEIQPLKGGSYKVSVQYGFKDEPDISAALALHGSGDGFRHDGNVLLPRPRHADPEGRFGDDVLVETLRPDGRNASTAMSFYKIPTNRVVELGAQVVL